MSSKVGVEVVATARNAFNSGKTRSLEFRHAQLGNMLRMMEEQSEEILNVIWRDLKKAKLESDIYEVVQIKTEIVELSRDLKNLAAPDKLPLNLLASLDKAYVIKQPYGVVLVLGAWNYPFLLSLHPIVGAIAAGNCVILKPSEVASHSAQLMAEIIPKYLDKECYHVIQADLEETKELLQNKFDYIFCTGSPNVGKSIMSYAAQNLTPVTLELGGKSPCYIDESADFPLAAKRILWGKFMNLGQTCTAPDYLLCSKATESTFLKVAVTVLEQWYGDDLQGNSNISRIINEKHCLRLKSLLDNTKGKIVFGGKTDLKDLWIEPTIVVDVTGDDVLMEGEIFGPLLPILTINSADEAIKFINSKPRPLALYSFAKNEKINSKIEEETISGGVCINDVISHAGWNGLPFGGVGDSGMGSYHGKKSFDTFSHHRSVLNRSLSPLSEKLDEARYPPYTVGKLKLFSFVMRYFERFNVYNAGKFLTHSLAVFFGAVLVACYFFYANNPSA